MKNVFIYVSDALRYDSIPESVAEEGKVVPTVTPGAYTPISFSSLVTGKNPGKHKVRSFYDTLETGNVFDIFENHSFYDNPGDAMCKNVFGNYTTSKELEEMEEPFFYVERALNTHRPYGKIKHGNDIPANTSSDKNLEEQYQEGVKSTEEHFWSHVEKLKELGLYENTLIIFTSDHGDLLNEKRAWKKRTGHNRPLCEELNIVPTAFINHDLDIERMRTIDIVPTSLSIIGKETDLEFDGIDLTMEEPDVASSMMVMNTRPLLTTSINWKWKEGWKPINRTKTDLATLIVDAIDPIRKKLRNTSIDDIFRPGERQRKMYKEGSEELEDIDF